MGAGGAELGQLVHPRPLGIGEPQALAHFVEDLADGVVAGLAEGRDLAVLDGEERAVAAREHEAHEAVRGRRGRLGIAGRAQEGGVEVPFQVVDGVEGPVPGESDGLADRQPHQQRAHETGAAGRRHHVHVRNGDAGPFQRLAAHRGPVGEVLARGDLRAPRRRRAGGRRAGWRPPRRAPALRRRARRRRCRRRRFRCRGREGEAWWGV